MDVPNLSVIRGIRGNEMDEWASERTNERTDEGMGVTAGMKEIPIRGWRQVRVRNEPILIMGSYTGTNATYAALWGFGEPSLPDHRGKRGHLRVRTDTREARITRTPEDLFQSERFRLFLWIMTRPRRYICFRHYIFSHSDKIISFAIGKIVESSQDKAGGKMDLKRCAIWNVKRQSAAYTKITWNLHSPQFSFAAIFFARFLVSDFQPR